MEFLAWVVPSCWRPPRIASALSFWGKHQNTELEKMKSISEFCNQLRLEKPGVFLHKHYGNHGEIFKANKRANPKANIVKAIECILPEMLSAYKKSPDVVTLAPPTSSFEEDLQNDTRVLAGTHIVQSDRTKCGGKGQTVLCWAVVPVY